MAAGLIERSHRITAIANKAGLFGFHHSADSQLTTTIRMADGSSSGWAGQPSTKLAEIDSAKLAATAIEKCARWKNPQKLEPGNYTVVLEPTAAGDLVRLMAGRFQRAQYRRRPHVSEQARRRHPAGRESVSRVHHAAQRSRSIRASPLRRGPADLLPTRAITWVDKGVIANLAYDRYWAGKTGKQPTPSAGGGFGGGGGGGSVGGGARAGQPDSGRRRRDARPTDRRRGARPAGHALLVHPLRQPADPAADRPDARRPVPDRERQDHHAR